MMVPGLSALAVCSCRRSYLLATIHVQLVTFVCTMNTIMCMQIYSKEMPLSLYLWARKMQAAERGYCMRPDSGLGGLVQHVPPIGW